MQNLLEKFREYLIFEKGFSKNTARKYFNSNLKFIKDSGITGLEEFTDKKINQEFLNIFWHNFDENISNTNKGNYVASIKSFIKYLANKSYIEKDFTGKISFPKPEQVFRDGFTDQEQSMIRHHLFNNMKTDKGRRNAALIITFMASAMRVSEALSLRVGSQGIIDFSMSDKCGSFEYYDENVWVRITGKGKRERMVILDPLAVKYINYHLKNREFKDQIVFNNLKSWTGNRLLSIRSANMIVQEVCRNVGIDRKITVHIFRHTAVVAWIKANVNTKKIINMLGHSSELSLERYYKRDRSLIKIFAGKESMLNRVKISSRQREFEQLIG